MSPVHSRLQRQIIQLYRDLLRAASPRIETATEAAAKLEGPSALYEAIRTEFRRQTVLYKKTDILQIEAALRRGQRRLEDLNKGSVDRMSRVQAKD